MLTKIINKTKFEHVMSLLLLLILAVALFVFKANTEVLYLILGALIGAFNNHNNKSTKEDEEVSK